MSDDVAARFANLAKTLEAQGQLSLHQGELSLRAARMLRDLAPDLAEFFESEQPAPVNGRPLVLVTGEQIAEVLRLRYSNGRLGLRAIGKLVDPPLSWWSVKRILDDYGASGNPGLASENPAGDAAAASSSNKQTGAAHEGGEIPAKAARIVETARPEPL